MTTETKTPTTDAPDPGPSAFRSIDGTPAIVPPPPAGPPPEKSLDALEEALRTRERALERERARGAMEDAARLEAVRAKAKAEEERVLSNAAARRKYQDELAAKIAAERAERQAQAEAELEPLKRADRLEWLIHHPERSESFYNEKIWPLRREQLRAKQATEAQAQAEDRLRASGKYRPY